jgi:hypothetical protein
MFAVGLTASNIAFWLLHLRKEITLTSYIIWVPVVLYFTTTTVKLCIISQAPPLTVLCILSVFDGISIGSGFTFSLISLGNWFKSNDKIRADLNK